MTAECKMKKAQISLILLVLFVPAGIVFAGVDMTPLCADRTAVERVYHEYRTGTKKPFDETMPPALIAQLVQADAHKEAVLKRVYGKEITPAMVEAEVRRINTTTRAPEMLAEIKRALGNDAERFARSMARPLVVDRLLRERFENDDALHAPQRREAEAARDKLKSGQTVSNLYEVAWELLPRPTEEAPAQPLPPPVTQGTAASQLYANEATAQLAQTLNLPDAVAKDRKHYLADLPDELQRVLKAQLNRPGDVSAVIETPNGFLVFRCLARDAATLKASSLTIPKCGYHEWLARQSESSP